MRIAQRVLRKLENMKTDGPSGDGVRSESSRPAPGESASRQVASIELAVSLVRSLFCGLVPPEQATRSPSLPYVLLLA
jgi:hypothetical protein